MRNAEFDIRTTNDGQIDYTAYKAEAADLRREARLTFVRSAWKACRQWSRTRFVALAARRWTPSIRLDLLRTRGW